MFGRRRGQRFEWLQHFISNATPSVRVRIFGVSAVLILANLLSWIWALAAFGDRPVLLGTSVLAYSLGLRHALDADHIAAIDNVTRKLMQNGHRPVAVGLFFALGHSTVVVLASIAVALTAHTLADRFASLRSVGDVIGTSVSALFLFGIGFANLLVSGSVYTALQKVSHGHVVADQDVDTLLEQRGVLARLFRPLFMLASQSWHLYPIGFLFALGFDTASEIGLFGLSAQSSSEISGWSVLVFPTLFAAGMTAIDTADGILMLGAYGWAYTNPVRKLYYNLTITSISALVALVIGGIETLGLLADHFEFTGPFWNVVSDLNSNFGLLGYAIIALFVASWVVSTIVYHIGGYERRTLSILLIGTLVTLTTSFFSSYAADISTPGTRRLHRSSLGPAPPLTMVVAPSMRVGMSAIP
jgi:nickel/cobalt transporter (NiCoT) family protein